MCVSAIKMWQKIVNDAVYNLLVLQNLLHINIHLLVIQNCPLLCDQFSLFVCLFMHLCVWLSGRKSGKGCYVYSGKKGKSRALNTEAEKIMEKYRIPLKGRWAVIVHEQTLYTHVTLKGIG